MLRLAATSPPALESLLLSPIERTAAEGSYWIVDQYYALDGAAVDKILLPAVRELWAMCLDFAGRAVKDDEILASLGIPEYAWAGIAHSWANSDPAPLARFDLCFDGRTSPKLHECNIDVVGLLYEATFFQRAWMDHQRKCDPSFAGCDQFIEIEFGLASAIASRAAQGPITLVSIAADPYEELWTCAVASMLGKRGISCEFVSLGSVPEFFAWVGDRDRDARDRLAVKAFRWDQLLAHGKHFQSLSDSNTRLISPIWSLVLSSKGCLPWLWTLNPGHPNLLEACFEEGQITCPSGFVSKPLFSIQGQDVVLRDALEPARNLVTSGDGRVARRIYQALCYLPEFSSCGGRRWASTGAWVANGRPAGISMTEAGIPVITEQLMGYVPHVLR